MIIEGNAPIAPAAVLEHLRHLLADKRLDLSARNKRFLRYVIEETLEGRQNRIKAYSIATEVFDRPATFDPQTDPVVRIEAGRIRRALERYYAVCEPNARLRISIPKGSYVPAFERVDGDGNSDDEPPYPQDPADRVGRLLPVRWRGLACLTFAVLAIVAASFWAGASVADRWAGQDVAAAPSVTVLPFEDATAPESRSPRSTTMTVEVVRALTAFDAITVSFPAITDAAAAQPDDTAYATDYVLKGVLVSTTAGEGLTAFLIRSDDWRTVWSSSIPLSPDVAVAEHIATTLASPFGVLYSEALKALSDTPGQVTVEPFTCIAQFNEYYLMRDQAAHAAVLDCLERAVEQVPSYAEAWAALSLTLANAYRWPDMRPPRGDVALSRAMEAAEKAVRLSPTSVRALHALAVCRRLGAETKMAISADILHPALPTDDPLLAAEFGTERQAP